MADSEDKSSKTEKPTRRRLRDARLKEGNVNKSDDLTSTAGIVGWILALFLVMPWFWSSLTENFTQSFDLIKNLDSVEIQKYSAELLIIFVTISLTLFASAAAIPLLVEYLQVGVIWAVRRITPDFSRLNPAQGMQRMFSKDSVVHVISSLIKTIAVLIIIYFVCINALPSLANLIYLQPNQVIYSYIYLAGLLIFSICAVFFVVSIVDTIYQRFSYIEKLKMSRREIRREQRSDDGDPHIRAKRRQLHQEWATRNALSNVRTANAVVTNPTHLAIALVYAPPDIPLPMVIAKGEGPTAQLIREEALQHGVPTVENVVVARALHAEVEEEDFIPEDLFRPVAEVLLWADKVRKEVSHADVTVSQ
jgi:type III secretion protein U